ncbi:hypothetical protein CHELA20_50756 [Hyphomicrobiales bacterium]|nr:hypothetical protein CHELA20_50756 [Hyphomicrobiales bacterium]CAH1676524.1 hypothetical protein CHELA41_24263 [Hyphomicrobiales bacterium]
MLSCSWYANNPFHATGAATREIASNVRCPMPAPGMGLRQFAVGTPYCRFHRAMSAIPGTMRNSFRTARYLTGRRGCVDRGSFVPLFLAMGRELARVYSSRRECIISAQDRRLPNSLREGGHFDRAEAILAGKHFSLSFEYAAHR